MSSTISINTVFQKHAAAFASEYATQVVTELANKHNFDPEEAMRDLGINNLVVEKIKSKKQTATSKPEKRDTPEIPLPWCGAVTPGWCTGLRLNHGLYSQCTMQPLASGTYCATCQKSADRTADGIPAYGNVEQRLKCGLLDYVDPKGRKCVPYANVIQKLDICPTKAGEVAARFGMNIPEQQFDLKVFRRGRPKRDAAVSDSSDEVEDAKRPRGRPKKDKKPVVNDGGAVLDDIFLETSHDDAPLDTQSQPQKTVQSFSDHDENMINEYFDQVYADADAAAAERLTQPTTTPVSQTGDSTETSKKEKKEKSQKENSDSESETSQKTKVTKVKIDGVKYLKDHDNNLYDRKTKEHLGALIDGKFVPVDDDDDDTSCSD